MIFSLLPTTVIAAGADDMPRVGFMVRLLPHQETTTEEAYLESGSTVEAYTDLYPYVYLRPYIEGQPFPPQKISMAGRKMRYITPGNFRML